MYPYFSAYAYPPFDYGIGYLSAILEEKRHTTGLLPLHRFEPTRLAECFESFRPTLVGVSLWSGKVREAVEVVDWVSRFSEIPVIVGGVHTTLAPEQAILQFQRASAICLGEGDIAVPKLVRAVDEGDDYSHIDNFWVRRQNKVIRNPLGPLVDNLDLLPFPNRKIFDLQRAIQATGTAKFNASRGCPYACAFCVEPYLRRLYPKGRAFRRRGVRSLVKEIKSVLATYPGIERIGFDDDCFTLGGGWLHDFSRTYAREVGLPFYANTRVDLMDHERASLLKDANCYEIRMGIESGNEYLRNQVLRKDVSNEQIIRAFEIAKGYGISRLSYNMIGLPYETEETIRETIELNRSVAPETVRVSIFQPYPGTSLHTLCKAKGWIKERVVELSYYGPYVLQQPSITMETVVRYFRLFEQLFQTKVHLGMIRERALIQETTPPDASREDGETKDAQLANPRDRTASQESGEENSKGA